VSEVHAENKRKKAVLSTAKKRFQLCVESEQDVRQKSLDDLTFLSASPDEPEKQWGQYALSERHRNKRPALVVNRIDQFAQHVTNAMRQNRVSAKVFPVDNEGDVETAEIRQGLLRHNEYASRADLAYDTAAFYAVTMGFGYYRLITDFCDPRSMDLEIKLLRIRNPFQVYLDPSAQEPDGSDAEYGFIFTDYTREEYEAEFPDSELANLADWEHSVGDAPADWVEEDGARVVEYYYKEWQEDTVLVIGPPDGPFTTVLASDLPNGELPDGLIVKKQRETRIPTMKWSKLNALELLEETEWPVPRVPIYRVIGNELDLDGKTILKGIVRNLKDAQRQYNIMLSAQTEAAMDRGTVVAHEGQLEGHEEEWRTRISKNPAVIGVQPVTLNGTTLADKPSRLPPDPTIPALTEARLMAADDLKALTGIYDAALGQKSNEQSGRAILSRQQQSDTANFHYQDNLVRTISSSTKDIIDLQPFVYDTERVIRIIGDDDSHRVVKINQEFEEGGEKKNYNFAVGKYDVVCTATPSFLTKREQDKALLTELVKVAPELMQVAPDLILKTLGAPEELVERTRKALPPALQDDGKQELPPQAQAAIAQAKQEAMAINAHAQQVEAELQKLEFEKQAKVVDNEYAAAEADKDRIAKVTIAEITAKTQLASERMKWEHEAWKITHQSAHDVATQAIDHGHEADLTERNAQIAADQAATARADQPTGA
jgi:hypothetical protein